MSMQMHCLLVKVDQPQSRVPIGNQFQTSKPALRGRSSSDECPRKRPNDPNPGLETCGRTTIQMTDAGSVPPPPLLKVPTLIGWDFFARSPSENRNDVASVVRRNKKRGRTIHGQYQSSNKCPVLTKMVQPSTLKGLCALMCGLRNQAPLG